jgi:hypothetical protein
LLSLTVASRGLPLTMYGGWVAFIC